MLTTHGPCRYPPHITTRYSDASESAFPFFLAGEADRLRLLRGDRDRERLPDRLRDLQQRRHTTYITLSVKVLNTYSVSQKNPEVFLHFSQTQLKFNKNGSLRG